MIIKASFLLLFLFNISTSFAQTPNQNLEWKALNSFLNQEYDEAIVECRGILEKHTDDVVANRTRFILARTLMQTEKYDEALLILGKTQLDAAFFKSGISGLIGDCKSEQGKFEEALEHYLKAVHSEFNESHTPYYLFKSYLCAKQLNQLIEANQYIQTIQDYFPAYSGQYQFAKYLTLDSVNAIKLTQREVIQPETLGIGTINGKALSNESFQMSIEIAQTNAIQTAQQQGQQAQNVDEDRVWKSFVEEEALTREYQRLKLYSDQIELNAYLMATDGFSPQLEFLHSPAFTDETGNFDANKLLLRINEMKNSTEPSQKEAWANTEEYYQKKLKQEKYFNLVGLISYTTSLEVDQKIEENRTYKADFYCERFRDLENETDSPTETELKAYYERNKSKAKYQNTEDTHRVIYLSLEIAPTKADTAAAYSKAKNLKKAFKQTQDDSSFVIKWSGIKFYTSGPFSTAVPEGHEKGSYGMYLTYPTAVAKEMGSAKLGTVVGPYLFNGELILAKIIGHTDEVINARHILLSIHGDSDDYSLEEIQEIYRSVTNENFGDLVAKYSGDTGSKEKGGYLGDFFFGDMVPTFATYCADAPIGEIGLVQTQFGYHIVQVTKRTGVRFPRLAPVSIPIKISNESSTIVENRLESIRTAYLSELNKNPNLNIRETMNKIAESKNALLEIFIVNDNAPTNSSLYTESAQDKFIQFAYDRNNPIRAISSVFMDSTNRFICIQAGFEKKGVPSYESIKMAIHADLELDNKYDILNNYLSTHSRTERSKRKKEVEISLVNCTIPNNGFEPTVVGKAIDAYLSGKKEIIVRGYAGIYCIEVIKEIAQDQKINKEELGNAIYLTNQQFFVGSVRRSLLIMNSSIDNRTLFRLGIRP
ncbi:MAG: tetratricopeptide repeat protein [Crocinitomicaceae bacterium]|nr:tetratricopeptide repeat protein [Flavobacteriales bacterium]NQZ34914.1 tetratricopeptide repeat protein [Crocinitomicaceae bacterium]